LSCWATRRAWRSGIRGELPDKIQGLATGLATAYHRTGQAAEGLRVAIDGLAVAEETGEQHYTAELYCLKGEILLALPEDNHPEATGYFLQALAIARGLHTKSWELRAATSPARL
jgi:hypothetical protein